MKYSVLFLGDIHSDTRLPKNWVSDEVKSAFAKHHLVTCNYEGARRTLKLEHIQKTGPQITQHETVLGACYDAGIRLFSLANNHVFDCGLTGFKKILHEIQAKAAMSVGADVNPSKIYRPLTVRTRGLVIDFFSACEADHGVVASHEHKSGIAWINDPQLDKNIILSKLKGHFVVCQPHAGEEIPLPLPEWRQRYKYLIDLGADIIVAHHPHQPQGWEKYHGKYIYYSLGNFYFSHAHIPTSDSGYMLSITIDSETKKYTSKVIPTNTSNSSVCIDMKSKKKIVDLSREITSPSYSEHIRSLTLELWEKYYSHYFAKSIKKSRFNLLAKASVDYPMVLHNLKIESHRWTILRAIENLME